MAQRSGGFSPSLDPFGTSRGGLGRYNVSGDSIQSLAETEAYAVQVAWGNGMASNEEYLASLTKLRDLETEGTRAFITAQNRLDDAKYTIGRNEHVARVNNSTSPTNRMDALRQLLAYDATRLGQMTSENSQAFHEQQDRVAGSRIDIRQARYGELVDKVNRGKGTTSQLLSLARTLQGEAGADPDVDEWQKTVADLVSRVADEKLADGFQAYQHNRLSGAKLLAQMDDRLAGLDEGSPEWRQLHNQREDLAESVRGQNRALADAKYQGQRASGKISDKAALAYLQKAYAAETPGTVEAISAGNRLRDFTFSLAEDKLRFDVAHKKRPIGDLIRFYQSYQHGMNPGSERWRQIQNAIESLKGGGSAGGGGGGGRGGGSSSKGGVTLSPKVLGGPSVMADFLGSAKAPPGFADLFRVDITNVAAKHWWDNNVRSMTDAFQDGRGTWTYYDKRGGAHELPFSPQLMTEIDALNVGYIHRGLSAAKTAKEAQTWIGRLVTATKQTQAHGATYTMDVYSHAIADMEKGKQRALAGGRFGEYANLMRLEESIVRTILGVGDTGPIEIGDATNPYLTLDQKQRIQRDLAKWAPRNIDPQSPFYNPEGDPVIGLIRDGTIETRLDPISGEIVEAHLDPMKGYVSQADDGTVAIIAVPPEGEDPAAWQLDNNTGETIPRYQFDNLHVVVRIDGQDVSVWQPIVRPEGQKGVAAGASVWVFDPGSPGSPNIVNPLSSLFIGTRPATPSSYRPLSNTATGRAATLPMHTTYTRETVTSYDPVTNSGHSVSTVIAWVSTDGEHWYRKPDGTGLAPRIVLGEGVTLTDQGKWQINGKDASPSEALFKSHVWGAADAIKAGVKDDKQFGVGAPGAQYQMRVKSQLTGELDFRPQWVIDSEEGAMIHAQALRGGRKSDAQLALDLEAAAGADRRSESTGALRGYTAPPRMFGAPGSYVPPLGAHGGAPGAHYATMGELLPSALRIVQQAQTGAAALLGLKPPALATVTPSPTARLIPDAPLPKLSVIKVPTALAPTKPPLKLPLAGAPGAYRPPTGPSGGSATRTKDDLLTPVKAPATTGGGSSRPRAE